MSRRFPPSRSQTSIAFAAVLSAASVAAALLSGSLLFMVSAAALSAALFAFVWSSEKARCGLAEGENRYQTLFDFSQSLISTHDEEGRLTSVNPAFVESLGYTREELIGKKFSDLIRQEYRDTFGSYLREVMTAGEAHGLVSMTARSGRKLVWQYQNIVVTEPGKPPYVLGNALDVTHHLKAQNALKLMSLTDELTGLYNRRGFLTLAEQQLGLEDRSVDDARRLSLMFVDMDGLKVINDDYGHEAGSQALQTLARTIKSVVRNGDLVARWGGDEFVILSVGADQNITELMLNRIKQRLDEFNAFSGLPFKVACSIGVAPVNMYGLMSLEEIIARADEAMYIQKKSRKFKMDNTAPVNDAELMHDALAWY